MGLGHEIGDTVEIIRVIEDDRTKVYEDVVHERNEALELALWTFVFVFVIALPVSWLHFWLSRWWRGRRSRADGPGAPS